MRFSRAWFVRRQDPMQEALRSVCRKNRQRFRVKRAFCLLCKPTNPFLLLYILFRRKSLPNAYTFFAASAGEARLGSNAFHLEPV